MVFPFIAPYVHHKYSGTRISVKMNSLLAYATLFLSLFLPETVQISSINILVLEPWVIKLLTTDIQVMVDLSVDENGLWAVMAMKENNNTLVMKIGAWNMELVWAWNISLNHNLVADMFIVCGVLYAVDR